MIFEQTNGLALRPTALRAFCFLCVSPVSCAGVQSGERACSLTIVRREEELPVAVPHSQAGAAVPARRRSATPTLKDRFVTQGLVVDLAVPDVADVTAAKDGPCGDWVAAEGGNGGEVIHGTDQRVIDATLRHAGARDLHSQCQCKCECQS